MYLNDLNLFSKVWDYQGIVLSFIHSTHMYVKEYLSQLVPSGALKIHWWVRQTKACSFASDTIVWEANAKQVNKYVHTIFLGSIKKKRTVTSSWLCGEGRIIVVWVVRNYLVKWTWMKCDGILLALFMSKLLKEEEGIDSWGKWGGIMEEKRKVGLSVVRSERFQQLDDILNFRDKEHSMDFIKVWWEIKGEFEVWCQMLWIIILKVILASVQKTDLDRREATKQVRSSCFNLVCLGPKWCRSDGTWSDSV